MAAPAIERQLQADFSAGMFRGVDPALIPAKGAYDIVGLLDEDGAVSGRGGATTRSTSDANGVIAGMWEGYIGATRFTLFWTNANTVYKLNADNSITSLGSIGVSTDAMTLPASLAGALYFGEDDGAGAGRKYDGTTWGTYALPAGIVDTSSWHVAVAGSRLWLAQGETLVFSDRDTPGTFAATSIHKIPGAKILRIIGFRDSLIALTTRGVWRFSNIVYNLTDTDGNVQHRVDQMSQDVVPWGGIGVTTWAGGLIVPAIDGVWELPLGVQGEPLAPFSRISDSISELYRSFTVGPRQAAVYRGHLLLPMDTRNATGTPEAGADVLVCRLDRDGRPWTRMGGATTADVMGTFLARTPAVTTEQAELLGAPAATTLRVVDVNYFEPASDSSEAGGADVPFSLTTRDFPTGAFTVNTATRLRVSYEMVDPSTENPTLAASFAVGAVDASFTTLTGSAAEDATGVGSYAWSLRKRTRSIRYKLVSSNGFSRLKVRGIESFSRPSARL